MANKYLTNNSSNFFLAFNSVLLRNEQFHSILPFSCLLPQFSFLVMFHIPSLSTVSLPPHGIAAINRLIKAGPIDTDF
jgi:hypothetical protein